MTQRQHDTRVALRRALKSFGPEANDTRMAAISFCYAHNIDPHFRYAKRPKFEPISDDVDKPLDLDVYTEWEWQRIVKRFQKEDA